MESKWRSTMVSAVDEDHKNTYFATDLPQVFQQMLVQTWKRRGNGERTHQIESRHNIWRRSRNSLAACAGVFGHSRCRSSHRLKLCAQLQPKSPRGAGPRQLRRRTDVHIPSSKPRSHPRRVIIQGRPQRCLGAAFQYPLLFRQGSVFQQEHAGDRL